MGIQRSKHKRKILNNLRYADDVAVISDNLADVEYMLKNLSEQSRISGLKINTEKTKILIPPQYVPLREVRIDSKVVEYVKEYVYLGQCMKNGKDNQTAEVNRRKKLAWAAFGKLHFIFKNKRLPTYQKVKVFNQCITPVITYGAETWALTRNIIKQLQITQRRMERIILGITLQDRKTNQWIRDKTKMPDIAVIIAGMKWRWAGHVARMDDTRWTKRIVNWRPWEGRRSVGRPMTRWRDDIKKVAGINWIGKAQKREEWKNLGEVYVQGWAN